jgi:hypothetical protein
MTVLSKNNRVNLLKWLTICIISGTTGACGVRGDLVVKPSPVQSSTPTTPILKNN